MHAMALMNPRDTALSEISYSKTNRDLSGVAQLVEHLPSMQKSLAAFSSPESQHKLDLRVCAVILAHRK